MLQPKKVNYLSNKELLSEIHKSKNSFNYFIDPKYSNYDCIVDDLSEITPELIQTTLEAKAKKMYQNLRQIEKDKGLKPYQIKVQEIDPSSIPLDEVVWRVLTFDHIPLAPERVAKPKTEADKHVKLNFHPFKHYIKNGDEFIEVGRSHWVDALENGHFCDEHGKISRKLAFMFLKLVDRYSQRPNWRGYTYVDEMRSQALLQLSNVGLQFDESRSDNPFAYYTRIVQNAFTRVLNLEKRHQNIRDDMLTRNGVAPSMTRQINNGLAQKALANGEILDAKKYGKKK